MNPEEEVDVDDVDDVAADPDYEVGSEASEPAPEMEVEAAAAEEPRPEENAAAPLPIDDGEGAPGFQAVSVASYTRKY